MKSVKVGERTTPFVVAQNRPLSKRVRFEIFKRDDFTCQYCGRTPPHVVLEVDHICPRAEGGTNDPINLITSCWDCNHGKSSVPINIPTLLSPDATAEAMRIQQEIGEAKLYLEHQAELNRLNLAIVESLRVEWSRIFKIKILDPQIKSWLYHYSPQQIVEAWRIFADRIESGKFTGGRSECFAYISGILRNRKKAEEQPEESEGA